MFNFLKKILAKKEKKDILDEIRNQEIDNQKLSNTPKLCIIPTIKQCETKQKVEPVKIQKCSPDNTNRGIAFFLRLQKRRAKNEMRYATNRIHRQMGFK